MLQIFLRWTCSQRGRYMPHQMIFHRDVQNPPARRTIISPQCQQPTRIQQNGLPNLNGQDNCSSGRSSPRRVTLEEPSSADWIGCAHTGSCGHTSTLPPLHRSRRAPTRRRPASTSRCRTPRRGTIPTNDTRDASRAEPYAAVTGSRRRGSNEARRIKENWLLPLLLVGGAIGEVEEGMFFCGYWTY